MGDASSSGTSVSVAEAMHDFGEVKVGETVSYTVEMTNTGEEDMFIEFVTASCGCTIPDDWETGAVKPGETTSFDVLFTGKPEHLEEVAAQGYVEQRIEVLANTKPEVTEFFIRAKVVE